MKLIRCRIEGFGGFRGADFRFSDGLNCLIAPNGYGKTTLAAFLKAMFYGMESYRAGAAGFPERMHYYPAAAAGNSPVYGGSLVFTYGGKEYRLERFFGQKSAKDDRMTVVCDGVPTDILGDCPGKTVFGMDAASFERTFYIGGERQTYGTTPGLLAAVGDRAGTLRGGENAAQAAALLRSEAYALRGKQRGSGRIPRLEETLAADRAEVLRLRASGQTLREQTAQYADGERRLRDLRVAEQRWKDYRAAAADYRVYEEKLAVCRDTEQKLEALSAAGAGTPPGGEADRLSPDSEELLTQTEQKIRGAQAEADALSREQETLRRRRGPLAAGVTAAVCAVLCVLGLCFAAGAPSWVLPAALTAGAAAVAAALVCAVGCRRRSQRLQELQRRLGEALAEQRRQTGVLRACLREYGADAADPLEVLPELRRELARQREREKAEQTAAETLRAALTDELSRRRREAEDYLRRVCPAGRPLPPAEPEPESGAAEALTRSLAALDAAADALRAETDRLPDLNLRVSTAEEELARLEERRRVLLLAADAIERAEGALRDRYAAPVRDRFFRFAAAAGLEPGDGTVLDADYRVHCETDGVLLGREYLSEGRRTLTDFCLRLALADAVSPAEPPFYILDDPFASLDEPHLARAKELLIQTAERCQILYFCCHESRTVGKDQP